MGLPDTAVVALVEFAADRSVSEGLCMLWAEELKSPVDLDNFSMCFEDGLLFRAPNTEPLLSAITDVRKGDSFNLTDFSF